MNFGIEEYHTRFTGFRKTENLEPYTHLTALWLGSNGLEKVCCDVTIRCDTQVTIQDCC